MKASLFFLFFSSFSFFLGGCTPTRREARIQDVVLSYEGVVPCEVKKPDRISSLDDYSEFMDYVCYASQDDEVWYAEVSDEFRKEILRSPSSLFDLAGQSGILSHNFTKGYDLSRIDDGQIGVYGSIGSYGTKSYALDESHRKVLKFEYFLRLNGSDEETWSLSEFPLYRDNEGFVEADNSEELFYLLSHGYFPIVREGTPLASLFSRLLGIADALVDEGMSDLERFLSLYDYIVVENNYDYESLYYKDSVHTDYACYFLEGVVNGRNAVCDGICKALVCLARLVGMEAYHVGSSNGTSGHAYLYVRIGDDYYLSCPTSGSKITRVDSRKYHTHTNLYLLTDYDTSDPGWDFFSPLHPEIVSALQKIPPYDYYEGQHFWIDGDEYDYRVTSESEARKILDYVEDMAKDNGLNLEIELQMSVETYRDLMERWEESTGLVVDNGIFEGELVKSFVFLYE